MITTVIFDIGNVLAGFAWKEYFLRFGYSEEIFQRLVKATVGNSSWQEHDRGALSDEEILNLFIENDPGIEKELRETLDNINGMLVRYDYAIPWIQSSYALWAKLESTSTRYPFSFSSCIHGMA